MVDMIPFIINTCYGKLNFSKFAIDLFLQHYQHLKQDIHANPEQLRFHPYMVHIVNTFGQKASGSRSRLRVVSVPKQYVNYIHIRDMDGLERVEIRFDTYKVDTVNAILCVHKNESPENLLERIRYVMTPDKYTMDLLEQYNSMYVEPFWSYEEERQNEEERESMEEKVTSECESDEMVYADHDHVYEMISVSEVEF